jgi:TolB-like protein/tetratricopeptide (TPR) repeat protein
MAGDEGVKESSEAESQPLKPAVAGSSRSVFISYASHDAPIAQKVCAALEAAGFRCWIAPRDVVPGTLYADGIVGAIDESKILVLILSKDAVASAHVGKELERATSKRHPIIALRLDTAPLTRAFEYFLNESQWIDVGVGNPDAAIRKLVSAVGQHLAPGTGATNRALPPKVAPSKSAISRRTWVIAAVLAVVPAGGYFLVDKASLHGRRVPVDTTVASTPVISDKSVAVLPFVDMSEKKDQEYFSDGLSEELIDMLTKVSDLRVPARTSSFYFKGKSEDIPTIAKRLLVAHVLEGSVRKSGNHMRITVQLVRADNGYHVWSQTYDRTVDDVFKVQDEIAGAVVKALKLSLLEPIVPAASQSSSTDAYVLYLKGVALFRRADLQDIMGSSSAFRESLKLDPNYAPAWGMLARAVRAEYELGQGTYADISPTVRAAAERSVKLDPNLPDAYVALASSYLVDWQWDAMDESLKKALMLEPGNPLALRYASFLAFYRGELELALRYAEGALDRDPLNFYDIVNVVNIYVYEGRYVDAESHFRRGLQFNPTQDGVHANLAFFRFMAGDPAKALAEIEQEPNESSRLWSRVLFLDALGRRTEADKDFAVYMKKYSEMEPFSTASAYARRGDANHAFEWLERAFQRHDDDMSGLKVSFGFKALHADPRYKAMLRKMNLPE